MLETPPEVSHSEIRAKDASEALREPASNLAVELTRVSAELQSINAGFQGHLQQAVAEMQHTMEMEFQARLEREIQATREQLMSRITQVQDEIHRVSTLLESVSSEITAMIDDPNAELSKVMRKKAEESVLRSYLDGLKFAAGEPR
jgi:predicted  nucleic acid-binding Zn-ribbon protein